MAQNNLKKEINTEALRVNETPYIYFTLRGFRNVNNWEIWAKVLWEFCALLFLQLFHRFDIILKQKNLKKKLETQVHEVEHLLRFDL